MEKAPATAIATAMPAEAKVEAAAAAAAHQHLWKVAPQTTVIKRTSGPMEQQQHLLMHRDIQAL
jgi:hypothetical protein